MSHRKLNTPLSEIHGVYQGKRPAPTAEKAPTYQRVPFSPRDAGHTGSAPERQPAKPKDRR